MAREPEAEALAYAKLTAPPVEPRPRSDEPTWACKRCGRHIPVLNALFAAGIAEFHRMEHAVDDLREALEQCGKEKAELRGTNAFLGMQAVGLVSGLIQPGTD